MRVMYVQPAEGFGGAERQGVLHIRRLRDLGVEVVPVVGPGDPIRQALARAGITDYVFAPDMVHEPLGPLSTLGRLRYGVASFEDWWSIQRRLLDLGRAAQVDAIFASRPVGWVAASRVAHQLGVPLVWRGGSRPTQLGEPTALRLLGRLWPPDAFVCNCEAVQRALGPLVPAPSFIVPNGVDTERFDPRRVAPRFRVDPAFGPDVPVVGFAGRPAPEKGLEVLAAALLRVARELPTLGVLIAGEFGWRERYEQLFAQLGLAPRTRFLGHLDDVESLYASCDVVALASHEHSIEGSPNAVLEALAMARPVVATAVGGVAEIIRDGVQGFLVPAGDSEALAARLTQLLREPALRARQGAAGRATILRTHSDWSVARQLLRVLREAAALRRAARSPVQLEADAPARRADTA